MKDYPFKNLKSTLLSAKTMAITNQEYLINPITGLNTLTGHINDEYIESLIPDIDPTYTPWGNYRLIEKTIKSKKKHNLYLHGLSGCGKTKSIAQVCAKLRRPLVVIPITEETTERQLMGGLNIIANSFVWQNGGVLEAMLTGAVLVLDEVDKGDSSLMCLQGILNGDKKIYIKELGAIVEPKEGFQVLATANTKGSGDERGLFNTSNILDGAFLDRFNLMIEQSYPDKETEMTILKNCGADISDEDIDLLTEIAKRNRNDYLSNDVNDVISTRQLVNIAHSKNDIFDDEPDPLLAAFMAAINRFEEHTKDAIETLYNTLVDPSKAVETDDTITFLEPDDIPEFSF